jgi:hypothetical protein
MAMDAPLGLGQLALDGLKGMGIAGQNASAADGQMRFQEALVNKMIETAQARQASSALDSFGLTIELDKKAGQIATRAV